MINFGCYETRWASLLIGLQEMLWATIPLTMHGGSLSNLLSIYGITDAWFFTMFISGALLVAGSILPWRSGRHIGLFLSCVVWFTTFGVFIKAGILNTSVATMPMLGVFCLLLLINDAKKKGNHGAIA